MSTTFARRTVPVLASTFPSAHKNHGVQVDSLTEKVLALMTGEVGANENAAVKLGEL